ncbi:MAG: hypothetical protein ACREHG_00420, partial [Candidatus Saccharimonadales bacterium]
MAKLNLKPLRQASSTQPTAPVTEPKGTEQEQAMVSALSGTNTPLLSEMVEAFDKDEHLGEVFEEIAKASEVNKISSFMMFLEFVRIIDDDILERLPVPGSEGGNNPDRYPIRGTKRKGSFYNELFDTWKIGRDIRYQLSQLQLASVEETRSKAEKKYQDMAMNAIGLNDQKRWLSGRQARGRTAFRTAAAIILQLQRINELPGVIVSYPEEIDPKRVVVSPFLIRDEDI